MWQELPPDTRNWSEDDWERFFTEQDRHYYEARTRSVQHSFEGEPSDSPCSVESADEDTGVPWSEEEPEESFDDELEEELNAIPAWRAAVEFSNRVYEYVSPICSTSHGGPRRSIARILCQESYLAQDYIAAGHELGYDEETLCGNIALCLRARRSLERCIQCLERLGISGDEATQQLIVRALVTRAFIDRRIATLREMVWWK